MQFLTVLALASSASASAVLRRQAPAAASQDVVAFFTGFSDGACGTVNTPKGDVKYSEHDGICQRIRPAKSLTAVDAHPGPSNGTTTITNTTTSSPSAGADEGNWYFYAYLTDDCDQARLRAGRESTAVAIDDDSCHAAPANQTFGSFLMYSENAAEPVAASSVTVKRASK